MQKSTVVIIGAGLFQIPAIEQAKRLGFYVVAVDGANDAAGFQFADQYFVADIKNAEECIKVLKHLEPVAVFALSTEIAVVSVAKICDYFKLPGVSLEAALNSTNKRRMRECFERAHLPSPKFEVISTVEELEKGAGGFEFPVVIKPADSAGSRGVSIVKTTDQLIEAFTHAKSYSSSGEVLMEEYMEGVEISVEACIQNGEVTILALSDKIRTPFPYPLDTRVIFPSNKDAVIQDKAKKIAKEAIHSCNIDNAVIHIEMMVTSEGPKLVELAARGAGFHVYSKLLSWVCDVNTVELLINIALGNTVKLGSAKQRGAVLSFPSAKTGTVKKISGLEEVQNMPGIHDAQLYIKVGDTVRQLKSGSDRVGHIIAFGDDRQSALRIADDAEKKIQIEIV